MRTLFVILFLCFLAAPFRFVDLGYSDYIGDERKAFIEPIKGQSLQNFFITRRKGPVQFLVSEIPHLITKDFRNEYAQRFPFAVISVFSVAMFYLMVKKLSGDGLAAFISSLLYLVNGFIVGFGRIAQYQNLNLLFNFLSIYFYTDLLYKEKKLIRSTLLGTFFFCLSVLSHWDTVFIIPVVSYIFIRFIFNKAHTKYYKIRILLLNFVLGCLLLLPFLIPYLFAFTGLSDNQEYFGRRVDMGIRNLGMYVELIRLYNPFYTLEFVSIAALFGILRFKKALPYILWFTFSFLVFIFFVRKPGTHIYNFVLPAIVLAGLGISVLINLFPKWTKVLPAILLLPPIAFLGYQSYFIFVDHTKEYPWEQKVYFEELRTKYPNNNYVKILPGLVTPKYTREQKLPLFGFPHYRHWDEINAYVNSRNAETGEDYGYITNEDKTISEWYMDAKYRITKGFYIIVIKRPVNFVKASTFPQFSKKTEETRLMNNGDWVVRIYKVNKDATKKRIVE
ncbi:hypothetical protein A2380_03240 [candidate division WWE3 bacterium RIFOXYB1_FULL_43_24]|nr:MAG: hypothetical protein A2212_00800 [candidate division WWE3 bacterium RIFOXYA1_FULL_42_9]OGC68896.1 MAG: hypothetical protein A2380_03240 [candidate division WWE3 bacterium RIFOXYB1_FULL_43_24]OGC72792.1 MAG: hypothetical protein A2414_03870 [candidate division WWE3 bacterium RIFOXYC1_FULL_42_13]